MLRSFLLSYASAPTTLYTLSLHDALPILTSFTRLCSLGHFDLELFGLCKIIARYSESCRCNLLDCASHRVAIRKQLIDRKSTRLNSSHLVISYAVFCLKKKKII